MVTSRPRWTAGQGAAPAWCPASIGAEQAKVPSDEHRSSEERGALPTTPGRVLSNAQVQLRAPAKCSNARIPSRLSGGWDVSLLLGSCNATLARGAAEGRPDAIGGGAQ